MTSKDLSVRSFGIEAQDIPQPLNFDERKEPLPDDQLAACVEDSTEEFIELLSESKSRRNEFKHDSADS